ncbi:MAG: 50S ribosomal protein L29 [Mycoplasmataceae bacterium]|nr:50S ribosomal protein L29 [Mycoplasmataceae bacterium]MBR3348396.1 50S ribosomal protein L29 [Mycoplasmataceae bacterium]
MKFKDLEKKTVSELNELLNDLRAESFTLGWKNKTQQQDQTHKIRLVKRDIARVLTALKQLELTNSINIKSSTKSKPKVKEGEK